MSDDGLEQELRDAADLLDPVPARLVQMATTAYTWRTVDAELARLVFDSLDAATVRGPGPHQSRLFVFQAGALTVDVEVTADGPAGRRIVGRLTPAQAARIECRCGDQQQSTTADQLGRFACTVPPVGPFRLLCQPVESASPLVTEWVSA